MIQRLTILLICLIASQLSAVTLSLDGDNRVRAAVYTDTLGTAAGHIDNRLLLGLNAGITDELMLRANLQFGDVTWGADGGSLTSAVPLKAYELYLSYTIPSIKTEIRVGQQYWRDFMGLINDDSVSGISIQTETPCGLKGNLAWIRPMENGILTADRDYLLLDLRTSGKTNWGILGAYGHHGDENYHTATFMPYLAYKGKALDISASMFAGMHSASTQATSLGLGTAVKASLEVGPFSAQTNVLYSGPNGIATLSPYYQNNLYIYGLGTYHDGVNLYWDWAGPYNGNSTSFLSASEKLEVRVSNRLSASFTAGMLLNTGAEVNCGLNWQVVPNLLGLHGYGALGWHETGTRNFLAGSTLQLYF